ncbi:MAG: hypothetical protein M3418_08560 [Gemmatimonadota bacterium]|nr:hypothetical protein [Gemmatimonadota bacterium]
MSTIPEHSSSSRSRSDVGSIRHSRVHSRHQASVSRSCSSASSAAARGFCSPHRQARESRSPERRWRVVRAAALSMVGRLSSGRPVC